MKLYEEAGLDDMDVMNLVHKVLTGIADFGEKEELFLSGIAIKEYFTARDFRHRDVLTPFMTSLSASFMDGKGALNMAKEAYEDKEFRSLLVSIGARIVHDVYNCELAKEEL